MIIFVVVMWPLFCSYEVLLDPSLYVDKMDLSFFFMVKLWQEEIHELLLSFAEAGATVVRLKGGDPLVSFHLGFYNGESI